MDETELERRERERYLRVLYEFREVRGRMGGKCRAQSLTPERRREIAAKAGKTAAGNLSPEERSARARKAAQARWTGINVRTVMDFLSRR
jgi:hypothetical protein